MKEADEFYDAVIPSETDDEAKKVARQAYAGLLWSKQFYNYCIREWLSGDPRSQRLRLSDTSVEIENGLIFSTGTLSRCRINGNTRGSRPGTWPFT